MSDPGFTVSPPDLDGFAAQISDTGGFYSTVGEEAFTLSVSSSVLPIPMGTNGQLSGVLALFTDDFAALAEAARAAAGRLAGGFGDTGQALGEVAASYRAWDDAARRRIEEAGASADDQAIDDAIEEGDPNVDWRARLVADGCFAGISLEPPKMTYGGEFGELNTALSVAGNLPLTIDALIQHFFGFSIIKGITEPLLGSWGFLWLLRDIWAAEADAFDTASTALGSGVTTLVGVHWTGDAATAFAGHVDAVRTPIDAHVTTLRTASALFGYMGDTMDRAGNDLANLIAELINLAVAVVLEVLNAAGLALKGAVKATVAVAEAAMDFFTGVTAGGSGINAVFDDKNPYYAIIKNCLGPVTGKIVAVVDSLIDAVDIAAISTRNLCEELNVLEPPALRSGEAGGIDPGDPEGLTEEPNDSEPAGLTEEPNEEPEPEGLTEEPNDGSSSDTTPAGGQQSHR
jgi:hypothetical protein